MNAKTLYERARNIPISEVAERLGGELSERNKNGGQKWRIDGKLIVVSSTGFGWFEVGSKGGKGAIDLVMLIHNCDSRAALNFLLGSPAVAVKKSFFPTRGVGVAPSGALGGLTVARSEIPSPMGSNWQRVRLWLTQTRGLNAQIIDDLHEAGIVYADSYANAIFIGASGGNTGCELRGAGDKKFAGRRGGRGLFELSPAAGELMPVAVVESAIDAISLRQLGYTGRILSTGGALNTTAVEYLKNIPGQIVAAFDSDHAGDGFSEQLAELLPNTIRLSPGIHLKDWNDVLLFEKKYPY